MDSFIEIQPGLAIPAGELRFTASRAKGPGGQHVNKVSSRVTLAFDVRESPSLDDYQKDRICRRLATRVNRDGILKLHCQQHRSYAANRKLLVERFQAHLAEALRRRTPRRKTRVSKSQRRARVNDKRQRGDLKRRRRKPRGEDD